MTLPETTTYEVWEARGGHTAARLVGGLTKAQAEEQITEWVQHHAEYDRPEAARHHYMVVAATTTRREVHG